MHKWKLFTNANCLNYMTFTKCKLFKCSTHQSHWCISLVRPEAFWKSWISFVPALFVKGTSTRKNIVLLGGTYSVYLKTRGLGIHDPGTKNTTTLSKWLLKLLTSDGIWRQLLWNKYLGSTLFSQVEWRQGDSHFLYGLMKVKRNFLLFGSFKVKDGSQVRFWEDVWLGSSALRTQYPILYNIARPKNISIAEVLCSSRPNLSWHRDLVGPKLAA